MPVVGGDAFVSHSRPGRRATIEKLDSPIGRLVFRTAREHFLLFQLGGTPDDLPPICLDRSGASLSWAVHLPGMRVVTPDLRSERRPNRVMGPASWQTLESELGSAEPGEQLFLLSSVPALGPRLSWVESVLHLLPGVQRYEDDLRDQWQSRGHRDQWRRLLRGLLNAHHRKGTRVTVLSGEIHLATHCTMATDRGPVHQLVASGITDPPPSNVYAGTLGLLARFGEAPLSEHRIRLHPLPAQRGIYAAQRNDLMLERRGGRWSARCELEQDGCTPRLELES